MLDGILVIDKPQGITSHDVVNKVRKVLHTRRVGHTGTLDPLATGVLIVCIEKATKLVEYLTSENKTYEVSMKFGMQTDTGDVTGNVVKQDNKKLLIDAITSAVNSFVGKQFQVPPMYSAIKINGHKLYELARKGIEVERVARPIEIYDISKITFEAEEKILKYTVSCSKGTYIRVLCENIASRLGTVGTMVSLRRIQTGKFDIKNAISIDEISEEKIITIEKLFDRKIDVKNNLKKLINGMNIEYDLPDGYYNLYADSYIGIGRITNKMLKREIIL